jgi:hypothetical protein
MIGPSRAVRVWVHREPVDMRKTSLRERARAVLECSDQGVLDERLLK